MQLIRDGQKFSFDQSVIETLEISGIPCSSGMNIQTAFIDVTTSSSYSYQEMIAGPTILRGANGETLMEADSQIVMAALDGGGTFHWIDENSIYTVPTRQECEAEEEALRLAEAEELAFEDY